MLDSKRVSTPDRPFHSRTLSEPRGVQGSSQDFYSPDVSAIRASTETRSSLQRSLKDDRRNITLSQDSGMFSSSSTLREMFRSAREVSFHCSRLLSGPKTLFPVGSVESLWSLIFITNINITRKKRKGFPISNNQPTTNNQQKINAIPCEKKINKITRINKITNHISCLIYELIIKCRYSLLCLKVKQPLYFLFNVNFCWILHLNRTYQKQ